MGDWVVLQRKIFTRWVNQKLAARRLPPIDDVVIDIHKGTSLVALCEILSELSGPEMLPVKFQAQALENMIKALKFCFMVIDTNLFNYSLHVI